MGQVLFMTAIGALLLWSVFFGPYPVSPAGATLMFLLGVFNIVFPWFYYFREHKKLGDQLMDDEGIMVEWELKYIASRRRKPEHYDDCD
jgi:hypothetical protein